MKSILTQLASVSRNIYPDEDIDLRYFYSGGLGSFNLKVDDQSNTFYALATRANNSARPTLGVNEITVNVDKLKQELVAVKSTNYLVNSVVQRIAQVEDAFMGIFTDENGYLLESPTNNIAFVMKDRTFVVPPFDKTLVGTTVLRCFDYIKEELISKGIIKEIKREYLKIEDVKNEVAEMMLVGGDFVVPVLKINDVTISQNAGDITKLLQSFLFSDKGFEIASEEIPFAKNLMI
jgi:branched-subunit amino acid aminotransferase/4-amino-4-deoxychorismate lyase